jgi:hypothetical protein
MHYILYKGDFRHWNAKLLKSEIIRDLPPTKIRLLLSPHISFG